MEGVAERQVDNTSWDGNAAMSACDSASCYRAICAGERTEGAPDERAHWALPHHKRPGAGPNVAGVRNALARLPQTQGLKNREGAERHLRAHMSAIGGESAARPPRDNLVRALSDGLEVREAEAEGGMPTLAGHFAVFDQWSEIDSVFEGNFLERIASGAFAKTIEEKGTGIKVLFNHGRDPQVGNKPLGLPQVLKEDQTGAYYEVPMLDTTYNRDLIPGLLAGAYGASFRFRVVKEEMTVEPERSPYNPEGLPERTIKEAEVFEFGPVTFPAYAGATAGLRSLTDEYVIEHFTSGPGLQKLARYVEGLREPEQTTPPEPAKATPRRKQLVGAKKRPYWQL